MPDLEIEVPRLDILRRAHETKPDDAQAGLALAQYYSDRSQLSEARSVLQKVLNTDPTNYAVLLDYGNVCANSDLLDEASQTFTRLTQLKPSRIEGWNNLGIVLLRQGNRSQAREAFESVLSLEPDNAGALVNMGNYYFLESNYTLARDFFSRAVEIRVDFPDAWFNLGNTQLEMGEFDKAIESYRKALRFDSEYGSAFRNMGVAYERLGNFEEAERNYIHALALTKGDSGLLINIGNVCTLQKKYNLAKKYYVRAVRIRPKEMAGWLGLRHLALVKGDVEAYLGATLAIFSRLDGQTLAESARVLRMLNQPGKADAIIHAADESGKRGDELDAERLLSYRRQKIKPDRMGKILARLRSDSPQTDTIRSCLAEYSWREGDYDSALSLVDSLHSPALSTLCIRWDSLIALGNLDGVQQEIESYVAGHEDCFECWYFLARVESLRLHTERARDYLALALEKGFSDIDTLEHDKTLGPLYRQLSAPLDGGAAES